MRITLLCQSYPPMVSGIAMAVRHMVEVHSLDTTLAAHGRVYSNLTAGHRVDPAAAAWGQAR